MITKKKITMGDAIISLLPEAQFVLIDGDYANIKWLNKNINKPSKNAVKTELDRLQDLEDTNDYKRLRKLEYPPIDDYLDAVVKNDTDAIQAYKDACNAVKLKYPKPLNI